MHGHRSIVGTISILAGLVMAMSTYTAGQSPSSAASANPKKVKVNCLGTLYATAFCDLLQQFMDAAPNDALNPDGTLNTAVTAVNNATQKLLRPDVTAAWTSALAPSVAVSTTTKSYAASFLEAWESARLDKQKGAAQTAAASTDMVAKPGASGLLSLAVESGAFASSVNGSSVTLNANLWNAFHLMTTGSLYEEGICSSNCVNPLRTTNVIATFTVDQSNGTTTATSGAANSGTQNIASVILPTSSARLSSITTRWNFWHSLDPSSAKFQTSWNAAKNNHAAALTKAGNDFAIVAGQISENPKTGDPNDAVFQALQAQLASELAADYTERDATKLVRDYENFFAKYLARCRANDPTDFNALVATATIALTTFEQLNQQVIEEARGTPILTAEYTFSRPASQPYTHDLRLIVAESWKTGAQLSANLAASIYASVPTGAAYGRLKDVQLSAQFDQTVGNKAAPPVLLSLAGYGQYQWDPTILNITSANLAPGTNIVLPPNAQQFLGTSGWLGIVQAKATIQLQKSISIPLAVKWSNKTDLLNAQDVRGQFGISYDFSSLVSLLKGQ